MKGGQVGSRNRTELSLQKIRSSLQRDLLLSVVALAAAVLSGCAGLVSGNNSQPAPQAVLQLTPSSFNFGSVVVGKASPDADGTVALSVDPGGEA